MKTLKENEKKQKRLSTKQKLLLLLYFTVALTVYYTCVYFAESSQNILPYQICTGVYISLALILCSASLVLSGKVSRGGEDNTPSQKSINRAKSLLLFALSLFLVLIVDFIDLFVVQYIEQLF